MSYNESLRKNSNYPLMTQSQWDAAPFNQADPEEVDFNVTISYTLSKNTTITTDDYDEDFSGDRSLYNSQVQRYEDCFNTPLDMFRFCREAAQYLLNKKDFSLKGKRALQCLIEDASDWIVDDADIYED